MRLLGLTSQEAIAKLVSEYRKEQREFILHITKLMWHMRGSLTREDAWCLSFEERQAILKHIDDQLKVVEKTGLALL